MIGTFYRNCLDESQINVKGIPRLFGSSSLQCLSLFCCVIFLFVFLSRSHSNEYQGAAPLLDFLTQLDSALNASQPIQSIMRATGLLQSRDVGALMSVYVDLDAINPSTYLLQLTQGGLSLPDRECVCLSVCLSVPCCLFVCLFVCFCGYVLLMWRLCGGVVAQFRFFTSLGLSAYTALNVVFCLNWHVAMDHLILFCFLSLCVQLLSSTQRRQ